MSQGKSQSGIAACAPPAERLVLDVRHLSQQEIDFTVKDMLTGKQHRNPSPGQLLVFCFNAVLDEVRRQGEAIRAEVVAQRTTPAPAKKRSR